METEYNRILRVCECALYCRGEKWAATPRGEGLSIRASRVHAWKEQMPNLIARFYDSLPLNVARSQEQSEEKRRRLQAEVDKSWEAHQCSSNPLNSEQFSKEADGDVVCFSLDCVFQISLPA